MGPFTELSLAEAGAALRSGTDPVELTRRTLAAIEASQPTINAFVTLDATGALAAAERAREELASGVDRGPLHGVPVAVKDIVDTAGLTTTMGSRHFAGHVPARDAEVVTRLRTAGAVVVGKTTTHEFAFGPTGDRAANGACTNPHDPTRMAGGSSAGSAAAVAAGLVPLAVGTDTGGSVRIPAALCGVAGIRPSFGRVPTDGVFPLSWSLDTVGVLAADIAAVTTGWEVLAGVPAARPQPPLADLRLATVGDRWFDRLADPVRDAWDGARQRLETHGARLATVTFDDGAELLELYRTVQAVEALSVHRDRLARSPELFDPEVRQRLQGAESIAATRYAEALRRLTVERSAAVRRFGEADILLLPTVPVLAPPVGARDTDLGGGWTVPRDALLAHNAPFSVLGLPALSLPVASAGLPVGLQLVGRPGTDEELLAAARVVERAVSPAGQR